MSHLAPTPCPTCAGPIIVILRRAWCMRPYAEGGCGAFWAIWEDRGGAAKPAEGKEAKS